MYSTEWRDKLVKYLGSEGILDALSEAKFDKQDFIDVELALCGLEALGIADQPVMTIWVLVMALDIPDAALEAIQADPNRRHILANLRVMLRHTGREYWRETLSRYQNLRPDVRNYTFSSIEAPLERLNRFALRNAAMKDLLSNHLSHRQSDRHTLTHPAKVTFWANNTEIAVDISETLLEAARAVSRPRLPTPPIAHEAWIVEWAQLEEVAQYLDNRESEDAKGWRNNWVNRLGNVRCRSVNGVGLGDVNAVPIRIDGVTHLAGMVGSGKSTLMQLLAVLGWRTQRRVGLVVADSMEAIKLAVYFNRVLSTLNGQVAAVAISGRSRRGKYLQQLHFSTANDEPDSKCNHDGFRWLDSTCLVQGLVPLQLLPTPLPSGREPCRSLKVEGKTHLCPLYTICPSQQLFHDLPGALIWITTPGAMGAATLPEQVDQRHPILGEVMYEHCDLIVFDEIETIQTWFDQVYAPELKMIGAHKEDGYFNIADREISEITSSRRIQPPEDLRWLAASRTGSALTTRFLNILQQGHPNGLATELRDRYFTASQLFRLLAEKTVHWETLSEQDPDYPVAKKQVDRLMGIFNMLHEAALDQGKSSADVKSLDDVALAILSEDMNRDARSQDRCRAWLIANAFDGDTERFANFYASAQKAYVGKSGFLGKPYRPEQLVELLDAALTVYLLEQKMRIVFNQWYSSPDNLPPLLQYFLMSKVPQHLRGLMPLPATGRLFGFRYQEAEGDSNPTFSTFEYAHIGRHYPLAFSKLREAVEGRSGAHVLALSGTSYLPGSTEFHVDIPPSAVLVPNPKSSAAIAESHFEFLPQKDSQGKAIKVSGAGSEMLMNLRNIVKRLSERRTATSPNRLDQMLGKIREKAQHEVSEGIPDSDRVWQDRERLLIFVNSYAQAKQVAADILKSRSYDEKEVKALTRNDEADDEESNGVLRSEAEQFRETGAKILVAPLAALGRAYNVLNKHNKAAFGAVYFLTRPMPMPFDLMRLVQTSNAYTRTACADPTNEVWAATTLYEKGKKLRSEMSHRWRAMEWQQGHFEALDEEERRNLAARTAGLMIQACGRLVRGDVPFYGVLVDAAWLPKTANSEPSRLMDTPQTSLFLAMLDYLAACIADSSIGEALYTSIYGAFRNIHFNGQKLIQGN